MKALFLVLYVLCGLLSYSQDGEEFLSISFSDKTPHEIIEQIENISDYRFFFAQNWLDRAKRTGNYQNETITKILNEIFENTDIHVYIAKDKRIYLTRNNLIYDELPVGFFGKDKDSFQPQITAYARNIVPYLNNPAENPAETKVETVRIGKENKNRAEKYYTLSGYVFNAKTNEPIPDLTIVVEGKNIGTVTNEDGYYEIQLPFGQNLIETRSLGIRNTTTNVILLNDGTLDFQLQESLEQLDEVVVSGEAAANVRDANTGTSLIVSEETKNIPVVFGERDILRVATALPGISTAGEGAAGFNVRGGNTDQNLILLDKVVIYNPSHFFGIFQALNPFTTKEAFIYKGNIPAKFGGRLSSVFDIQSKDGNMENFSGEGSIGPVTGNLALEIPLLINKSSLLLGGRSTYSGWILRALEEESLQNSEASFYDIIAKYSYRINQNNDVKATAYYSKDNFSITSDSLFSYRNRLLSLNWDHKFNEKHRGDIVFSNSEYAFDIRFDGENTNDFNLGYKVSESALALNFKYVYNSSHALNYGISSKLYAVSPGNLKPLGPESTIDVISLARERGLESAVYLADTYTVNDRLLVDAGVRFSFFTALGASSQRIYEENAIRDQSTLIEEQQFDQNEIITTYGGPEFRLSTRYFLRPDFSLKASFNNTLQYLHALSNTTTVSPIDTWKLSDLNISPARANQYAFGFYSNLAENKYELSLEGYYKTYKNVLDFKVGSQILLNETIETEVLQGDGRAYGIEFLLRKSTGKLNGWLGYTYSRSFLRFDSPFSEERINNGAYFPANFDKPHDLSLVANYKLTKRFSLSTNFVYQTGRPITFPVGSYRFNNSEFVFFSNRNEFRIPDYYRLDVGLNIEGNHKIKKLAHSFWTISVYNVLGRNNPYSVFFLTENGEVKALQSSIFAIPIPSITYNFKF